MKKIVVVFLAILMTGCTGLRNPNTTTLSNPVNNPVILTVNPSTATLPAGSTQQFSASVTNTSNTAVIWSVDGVVGGNNSSGVISSSGLYSAPTLPGNHTVTAASSADKTKTGSAQVTVTPVIMVAVSPKSVTVLVNQTQKFTATVKGISNTGATWSVDGAGGGNGNSGIIDSNGLYTAPPATGTHTIIATSVADGASSDSAQIIIATGTVSGPVSVLTYHNDGSRTGQNLNETILSPSNVNVAQFGKRFSFPVDGQIYAQPLYVPNLNITGGTHNVVFVATEHDSVYAFDADGLSSAPLWKENFGHSVPSTNKDGINTELGITGTPVIDSNTNTLYVVSETSGNGSLPFKLHALDLATGQEKFGGPVVIAPVVNGTGDGNLKGVITLEGGCYQRAGLALVNNVLYIAFGQCQHGWLIAYAPDSLTQTAVFNTTPNSKGGAIWMGGGAPANDREGNLYLMTGVDGDSTVVPPNPNNNDSFLKLTPSPNISVLDFFTPSNESFLRINDADLGSGEPILVPDNNSLHPHELIGAGKDGRIFVLNRDQMGGFNPPTNPMCDAVSNPPSSCDHVLQAIPDIGTQQFDNLFGAPAYWNGNLYYHPEQDVVKVFHFSTATGLLSAAPTSHGGFVFGLHGATPSISANGNTNGILWEIEASATEVAPPSGPAVLRAYDALNLGDEIYDSSMNPARDTAGTGVKFTVPTIANGNVYVGTGTELDVYGLLPN